MEELNISRPGPILYGFYNIPSLSTATTWSETHSASVPADSHKASLLSVECNFPFLITIFKFFEL